MVQKRSLTPEPTAAGLVRGMRSPTCCIWISAKELLLFAELMAAGF